MAISSISSYFSGILPSTEFRLIARKTFHQFSWWPVNIATSLNVMDAVCPDHVSKAHIHALCRTSTRVLKVLFLRSPSHLFYSLCNLVTANTIYLYTLSYHSDVLCCLSWIRTINMISQSTRIEWICTFRCILELTNAIRSQFVFFG